MTTVALVNNCKSNPLNYTPKSGDFVMDTKGDIFVIGGDHFSHFSRYTCVYSKEKPKSVGLVFMASEVSLIKILDSIKIEVE